MRCCPRVKVPANRACVDEAVIAAHLGRGRMPASTSEVDPYHFIPPKPRLRFGVKVAIAERNPACSLYWVGILIFDWGDRVACVRHLHEGVADHIAAL